VQDAVTGTGTLADIINSGARSSLGKGLLESTSTHFFGDE
jgi:hypothetical protein